jgi:hypothetical protein
MRSRRANRNPAQERVLAISSGKHSISVFSKPSDTVAVFHQHGRPYPPRKRQAALQRRLEKWSGTLRFDVLAVDIVGS